MAIPFNLPTREETEDSYRRLNQLLVDLYDVLRQILMRQRGLPTDVPPQPPPRNRTCGGRRADGVGQQLVDAGPDVIQEANPSLPVFPLPDVVLSVANIDAAIAAAATTSTASANLDTNTSTASSSAATITTPSITPAVSVNTEQQYRPQPPPRRRRRRTHVATKTVPAAETAPQGFHCREDWVKVGEDLRKIADEFRASLQEQARKPPPSEPSTKSQISLLSLLLPAPLRGSLWTAVIFLLGWRLFHAAL